jgi:hypothetical protein
LENERPFQAIFLNLPAQNPDVLARGATTFGLQMDIANDLLSPNPGPGGEIVVEDFETQRLKVSWRRGIGRDMEYGVGTNLTARNGGFLDPVIEAVHKIFDTEGNGFATGGVKRANIPRGRSILTFTNTAGQTIAEGSAFGLGDTSLWMKKQLSHGKLSSSARVALKVPTGSEGHVIGSGGFDAGVALDARLRLAKRWALWGNAGAAKYGNSSIPGSEGSGTWGSLGYEWRVGQRDSVIGQITAASRTVTTGNPFADRTPVIISLGYKKQVSPKGSYWLAFSENGDYRNFKSQLLGSIGPDFTVSFGYEFKH